MNLGAFMKVVVNVDKNLSSQEVISDARKKIALETYKTGDFSLGYCVDLSGMFYADFMKLLKDNQIAIINKEDVAHDYATIQNF